MNESAAQIVTHLLEADEDTWRIGGMLPRVGRGSDSLSVDKPVPSGTRAIEVGITLKGPDGYVPHSFRLLLTRNTIPGEGAWRLTEFIDGRPIYHRDGDSPDELMQWASIRDFIGDMLNWCANEYGHDDEDYDYRTKLLRLEAGPDV